MTCWLVWKGNLFLTLKNTTAICIGCNLNQEFSAALYHTHTICMVKITQKKCTGLLFITDLRAMWSHSYYSIQNKKEYIYICYIFVTYLRIYFFLDWRPTGNVLRPWSSGLSLGLGARNSWALIPALTVTPSVALGKSLNLSTSVFPAVNTRLTILSYLP